VYCWFLERTAQFKHRYLRLANKNITITIIHSLCGIPYLHQSVYNILMNEKFKVLLLAKILPVETQLWLFEMLLYLHISYISLHINEIKLQVSYYYTYNLIQ